MFFKPLDLNFCRDKGIRQQQQCSHKKKRFSSQLLLQKSRLNEMLWRFWKFEVGFCYWIRLWIDKELDLGWMSNWTFKVFVLWVQGRRRIGEGNREKEDHVLVSFFFPFFFCFNSRNTRVTFLFFFINKNKQLSAKSLKWHAT